MSRRFSEHLDYIAIAPGGPIDTCKPYKAPCNEPVSTTLAIVALAATATQGVMQYQNAEQQAKQEEYNAEAQAAALRQEATRQQAEFEANRRRTMQAQRRARSQQLASIADSGFMTGTGTTLEIEADTWNKQQLELADMGYYNSLNQRQLGYQAQTALEMGRQQAGQIRSQKAGIVVGTVGQMASIGMQAKAAGAFSKAEPGPSSTGPSAPPAAPTASGKQTVF